MRRRRRPPRLLVRTMMVTFPTVALLVAGVLVVVVMTVREQVRQSVIENLENGQRVFAALEARRQRELRTQVASLAENSTLKAALDTYQAERRTSDPRTLSQLLATVARELDKLAAPIEADAAVIVDPRQDVLASSGRLGATWKVGQRVAFGGGSSSGDAFDGVVHVAAMTFRAVAVPIVTDETVIGRLFILTNLDENYARQLTQLSRTRTAIVSDGALVATTLPSAMAKPFESAAAAVRAPGGTMTLGDESYAYRQLMQVGDSTFYALASIDEFSRVPLGGAMRTLGLLAAGATVLAFGASFWLARLLTEPIGRLSRSLTALTGSRALPTRLKPTGSSRELDALTEAFSGLMASVAQAELETQSAYTGAIRALATALDARDPYTAGHSERVSVLSVAIGRVLELPQHEIEVLRLGALLHDIGKIGVPDDILMKPGPLTAYEFEKIQQHPTLGARILRAVPFLAPHIPIVELHHERPDGRGYPHRLRGDDIPLLARIVHVADAYDAITSARAYRAGRSSSFALTELWRCAGTEYHAEIVGALASALPGLTHQTADIESTEKLREVVNA